MCNILVILIVSSYLVQQKMCELCFKQEQTLKYFYPESKGFNITVKSEDREESRLKITCIIVDIFFYILAFYMLHSYLYLYIYIYQNVHSCLLRPKPNLT